MNFKSKSPKKLLLPISIITVFSALKLTGVIDVTWLWMIVPILEILIILFALSYFGPRILQFFRSVFKKSPQSHDL